MKKNKVYTNMFRLSSYSTHTLINELIDYEINHTNDSPVNIFHKDLFFIEMPDETVEFTIRGYGHAIHNNNNIYYLLDEESNIIIQSHNLKDIISEIYLRCLNKDIYREHCEPWYDASPANISAYNEVMKLSGMPDKVLHINE